MNNRVKCWLCIPRGWEMLSDSQEALISRFNFGWVINVIFDAYFKHNISGIPPIEYLQSKVDVSSIFFLPTKKITDEVMSHVTDELLGLYYELIPSMNIHNPELKRLITNSQSASVDSYGPCSNHINMILSIAIIQ